MYKNLFLTMLLGGLWHGASWTFILWGVYHGALLCVHKILNKFGRIFPNLVPHVTRNFKVFLFFHAVVLGWLLFRASSILQAKEMLYAVTTSFHWSEFISLLPQLLFTIAPILAVEAGQLITGDLMFLFKVPRLIKIAIYALMTYLIVGYGVLSSQQFIYFQF